MRMLKATALIPLLVAAHGEIAWANAPLLDPHTLDKYVDPLPAPPRIVAKSPDSVFTVRISEFQQQLHRDLPPTTLWGYNESYPGPTIEAFRFTPIAVTYLNELFAPTLLDRLPVDQTLHWADPFGIGTSFAAYYGPVPTVVHLHGGENPSDSDGHPEAWFTPFFDLLGPRWTQPTYDYPNTQPAATLWYHDHTLGITRLNVWAGLAGFYLLRDPENDPKKLPNGKYEREILIQDRLFDTEGQINYAGDDIPNPDVHPFWSPEVFGDTIVTNGKIWPYLEVEPRKYRFRLLNGSNGRFYELTLDSGQRFHQIGTDGGYLDAPVAVENILLAPSERADVIVDFSSFEPGTSIVLKNNAPAPYPFGALPDPDTTGQIMQFRVVPLTGPDKSKIPQNLRPNSPIVPLTGAPVVRTRTLTLNEQFGPGGPLGLFLDGRMWEAPVTELPLEGTTEIWEFVNLTGDTHPIHLHLIQFQILNRQPFRAFDYLDLYKKMNPIIPLPPPPDDLYFPIPVGPFLSGAAQPPDPSERGWKDAVRANPGEVTRILVRFAPTEAPASDLQSLFSFDPSTGPGYVWHCHILEHEDNDMMRPYRVRAQQ